MLMFVSWRGIKVLCRCRCGRLVEVRPVEFTKAKVAECRRCGVFAAAGDIPPANLIWLGLALETLNAKALSAACASSVGSVASRHAV